ncbi:MAG: FAD-binding oxidoreductase, partial [Gammaproteobacteria bacterium]|nr:FAD-binding oxidoreductase [Gammaproteobacteria bacterium]
MTKLLEQLRDIVGVKDCVTDPDELQPNLTEWRGNYVGKTAALIKPSSAQEVAAIVTACAEVGAAIVPQGGNTGMCGGAVPDASGNQVILSLEKMDGIRSVDAENFSMEVDAGCILAKAQDAAKASGRYLPLSLGAEGSCQVGGNIATNAGGINVGRYGTARALVLGLEVVLADGTIVDAMRSLRKDTAGYDLKQLFIGSEGTLGIITAASLRLFPDPGPRSTALLGIESAAVAVDLFGEMRSALDDRIESFELVSEYVFGLVTEHIPDARLPFDTSYPWYVLIESATGDSAERLEDALGAAAERGQVLDAVIAKNEKEAADLWRLRHSIAEAERASGKGLKHDISVPLSSMQAFLRRGDELLETTWPDARLVAFGHIGDGNLHYNVVLPDGLTDKEWHTEGERVSRALYDLVHDCGGSFSAEHGVGQSKRAWLELYRG